MLQIQLDFTASPVPAFDPDTLTGKQLKRLYNELARGVVITCQDCGRLGIGGTALPRRIKDLKDKYHLPIQTVRVPYTRIMDEEEVVVHISSYRLIIN